MTKHQYDPAQVKMTFGGAIIEGYAEGSFINVQYNADLFALTVGSDGEATRSKSNNKSARVTVTLMPGALANAILGGFQKADDAGGVGVLPLSITDLSTGSSFIAEGAWIVKPPDYDFQTEAQPREWIIETDNLLQLVGAAV